MTKNKYQTFLLSSRPISWINTTFPFAAGYIVTGGTIDWLFLVTVFYFLVPYNILIYVTNDVYDYESDLRNPRKGGAEGALVPPALHAFMLRMVRLTNIPFLLLLLTYGTLTSNSVLLLVVFGALAYSVPKLRYKEIPVLDSITSSLHFVGPLLYALSITGWHMEYWPYVLAFFLWGMASHAFGAVQDINADRAANICSIATVFGAQYTVRFSWMLYVVTAGLLFSQGVELIAVGIAALLYAVIVSPYLRLADKHAERANAGWRHFLKLNQLTGFIIVLTLILTK